MIDLRKEKKIENGYSKTKAFSYLAKVSNEKFLQKKEILKIIKNNRQRENYLDIGAGAGDICFDVSKKFKKSILIEPGDKMFQILKDKAKKKKNIKLIKSDWGKFYLKNKKKYAKKFDLITLVHVVYFLKPLKEKIKEILEFLASNGKLIIICPTGKNEKRSFYAIRQKLLKKPFESHPEFLDIKKMFPKKTKYRDMESITKLRTFGEMEKNPISKENKPTNYYLKFAIKKEFKELSESEKNKILSYIKEYEKNNYYFIPGYFRVYTIDKK